MITDNIFILNNNIHWTPFAAGAAGNASRFITFNFEYPKAIADS
jgi:hypothetical protein